MVAISMGGNGVVELPCPTEVDHSCYSLLPSSMARQSGHQQREMLSNASPARPEIIAPSVAQSYPCDMINGADIQQGG